MLARRCAERRAMQAFFFCFVQRTVLADVFIDPPAQTPSVVANPICGGGWGRHPPAQMAIYAGTRVLADAVFASTNRFWPSGPYALALCALRNQPPPAPSPLPCCICAPCSLARGTSSAAAPRDLLCCTWKRPALRAAAPAVQLCAPPCASPFRAPPPEAIIDRCHASWRCVPWCLRSLGLARRTRQIAAATFRPQVRQSCCVSAVQALLVFTF